jgi:hypothetical protein
VQPNARYRSFAARRPAIVEPSTKKLPARPPHQSHHSSVDSLCATCPHFRPHITGPCTTTRDPQLVHINHTTTPSSSTTRRASRAGPTSGCPQHAQDLILILESLRSFFFEKRSGDSPHPHPGTAPLQTHESLDRLAFKMEPEALRLWFDSRFGCRDGLRVQAFVNRGIPHPTRDRVERMKPGCSRL